MSYPVTTVSVSANYILPVLLLTSAVLQPCPAWGPQTRENRNKPVPSQQVTPPVVSILSQSSQFSFFETRLNTESSQVET